MAFSPLSLSLPSLRPTVALLLWREARPVVQVIFALRFWVAVGVTARHWSSVSSTVVLMALAVAALAMATYLANGVYDSTEDVANRSARPIARGELDPGVALRTAQLLTVVGLALAGCTGSPALVVIAVVTAVMGWGYSAGRTPLKCSAAGTFVASAAGGGLTYAAGALATGDPVTTGHLIVFVLLSSWMGVAGASKDLGDAVGDRLAGRHTLPVVLGERRARLAIAAGTQLIAAAAWLTAAHWPATAAPSAALVVGAVCVGVLCLRGSERDCREARRRPYRAFMVTQYVANPALLIHSLL